jgi:hypothetical protein
MPNALKKINARVKELQKKHPNTQRKTLQKQAGREYKAGKLGGLYSSGKKRKKVGAVRRTASRKAAVKRAKRLHAAEGRLHTREGRAIDALGSVPTGTLMSKLRAKLKEEIGFNEAAKLSARTASSRRNIQDKINDKKAMLRRLILITKI